MKKNILIGAFAIFLILSQAASCNEFNADVTISKHYISRGAWQWVLIDKKDSFLCNNIPDSLQVDNKTATIKYKYTGKADTLYQVGPVDLPIYFRTLPQVEIINVN